MIVKLPTSKAIRPSGSIKSNWRTQKKLQEMLDYTLALLSDLERLFKGKKFVDFVAVNQLKYVSTETSRKLQEITDGNYGLEADENGKFLIRDYKNGGAQRDATTLSGGEIFLALLSLALALSICSDPAKRNCST